MLDEDNDASRIIKPAIPYAKQSIDQSDIDAVVDALRSDFVTQGPRLTWFEDALKETTGASYAVAVSSGTAALHLSYLGLDIGSSDYGICPAITFAATANGMAYCGAEVGFCDVDALSGRSMASAFEEAIETNFAKGKPRALVPVSFAGSAPDLEPISEVARKNDAYVIEDAAHSIGAFYKTPSREIFRSASCSHSDAATLSFHPVKQICAGEGGAILTNDETLAKRARRLRSHGIEKGADWNQNMVELGYNYRMTELQAALGYSQLGKLDGFLARRRQIAERYHEAFAGAPFASKIRVLSFDPLSSWHLFVIHFENGETRKSAYRFLRERGINTQIHYPPVYHHDYHKAGVAAPLPGAEAFYRTCMSLPIYPELDDKDQRYVISELENFLKKDA